MEYADFDENTYHVRWCDQRNKKCSEVWPKDCPQVQRETRYAEALKAYNERYNMKVDEYYAWCAKIKKVGDICEAEEYAGRLAGPEPKEEDF
jgi:hypothetical protein